MRRMLLRERDGEVMQSEATALLLREQGQSGVGSLLHRCVYLFVKRTVDVLIAVCALIILSPVFLVTAFLVKREDGGPVFYKANRLGQHGKLIHVLKFRSMKLNTSRLEDILTPDELTEYYKEYKLDHDPRITRIGNFLRKCSIDELPQLVNILRGDMSIVGPRPIVRKELEEKYTREQQAVLLSVKPGLTGAWQVYGRSNCTYESGVRQKVELEYVENRGIKTDTLIMLKTIPVTVLKVGAK